MVCLCLVAQSRRRVVRHIRMRLDEDGMTPSPDLVECVAIAEEVGFRRNCLCQGAGLLAECHLLPRCLVTLQTHRQGRAGSVAACCLLRWRGMSPLCLPKPAPCRLP
jgi:hypothetical protein